MWISWEGRDGLCCGLIVWFLPTDSSLTAQQMVGVGLGSVAFVTILAFLSFSAVWYVRVSFLKNEWNGGESGWESCRTAGYEETQGTGSSSQRDSPAAERKKRWPPDPASSRKADLLCGFTPRAPGHMCKLQAGHAGGRQTGVLV